MKIYQIKYKKGGIQKYAYTNDFIDYYETHKDVKTKINLITEKKNFMRKCKKCGLTKKYNEFKIEKNNLTGYSLTLCADCHRIAEKTKYRNKNKDTIIAF